MSRYKESVTVYDIIHKFIPGVTFEPLHMNIVLNKTSVTNSLASLQAESVTASLNNNNNYNNSVSSSSRNNYKCSKNEKFNKKLDRDKPKILLRMNL